MVKINADFAFSTEVECLTSVPDNPSRGGPAVEQFLQRFAEQAPSLPGTNGVFNGYVKAYCDSGLHIELALIECDSPFLLPSVFERVQILATRAIERLAADGIGLVLANNNHSGLLKDGCPVWGDHGNYLVDQHPSTFTEEILPFLITRLYQGAGGIHYPTGNFLAAVRPICMELPTGGGTTERRAISSTARQEHHMGSKPNRFRYHLILGDGHRSHYNMALQFGATALAIKAILFDPQLRREIAGLRSEFNSDWVKTLKRLNVLARPNALPSVHPLVIKTQRIYLNGARRYAAALDEVPRWVPRILRMWEQTLDAYERLDRPWLAARLDAFAKYEFYSAVLESAERSWKDLPGDDKLFCELALLDHSYHEFCNPRSVFARLEAAGLLRHRVTKPIQPGEESDPFVPETRTRARVRARFIREHSDNRGIVIDWSCIHDRARGRRCRLHDPFARKLGTWETGPTEGTRDSHLVRRNLGDVLTAYHRGQYEAAHRLLQQVEEFSQLVGSRPPAEAVRYRAWLQAKRGFTDGRHMLELLYAEHDRTSLSTITDFCCILRFQGLVPDLRAMQPWIRRGQALLQAVNEGAREPSSADAFREHVAYALLKNKRADEALEVIQEAKRPQRFSRSGDRVKARILATFGETCRVLGDRRAASRYLRKAAELQTRRGFLGDLADFTYPSLAKWERTSRRALEWLNKAAEIQLQNNTHLGHTLTLLLASRLTDDGDLQSQNHEKISRNRQRLPALAQCHLLGRILDDWEAWSSGQEINDDQGGFWGL